MSTLSHDRQLEAHIRGALLRERALSGCAIDVRVEEGRAILRGAVDDDDLRRKAEHIASVQAGVTAVSNLLARKADWAEEGSPKFTEFEHEGDAQAEVDPTFNTKDSL